MDDSPILPVNRSKDQARTNYDRLSRWYDLLAGAAEWQFKETGLELLDTQPGERILEIGFGTGACLVPLAEAVGHSGHVAGIDLSPGMLAVAASRLAERGLAERVELTNGDAAELPYPDNSFDAVFISFTLELFDTPEIPIVLAQCRRVLHKGGRLCLVAMGKRPQTNLMTSLYEWAHKNFETYADCRPIYARKSLEDAGFQISSERHMSMFGLPVDILLVINP
jgi:ubiquinone/menaquinone biosynthesis C-methylase UbiE